MRRARARAVAAAVALWSAGPADAAPAELVPPSSAWVRISTAELAARYDTVWAVSDVHGRLRELEQLLVAAGLAVRDPAVTWNPARGRDLLVVAGDLVDGGPDSVGVVLLLARLEREASAAGSRVVVLLGNHDAAFLAHPGRATPELLASAARHAPELGLPPRFGPRHLENTPFGAFLRSLPVAAFVGSWLFAHAGYIDAAGGEAGARAWLARLDETIAPRDRRAFAALLAPGSLVADHRWERSAKRLRRTRERLSALGLDGLVFGHDPDALGARATMAMSREGWLIKLDAGLKQGASAGMLLRCEVHDIVSSDELAMVRGGAPTCRVETPDGATRALAVR